MISENGTNGCIVDMGLTLAPYVTSATRTFILNHDNTELEIYDVVTGESETDHILTWNLVTRTHPRIESEKSIILSKNGYNMRLEFVSDYKVTPMVESASTDKPYDSPNCSASRVGLPILISS